jgi:predicted dehydrogenase
MIIKKSLLLVGSGFMAREYLKVLATYDIEVIIVGRSDKKIQAIKTDYPNYVYFHGGLDNYLRHVSDIPEYAINATSVNQLKISSIQLIEAGVKNVLIEKPGDLTISGLNEIKQKAIEFNTEVLIAYNRRCFSSVLALKEQVEIDGGITNCHFEFTEWIHTIDPKMYDVESLKKWIIANSSHVIDTVFNLIGFPKSINTIVTGKNQISWHPSGSVFAGSGISINNIPFTYNTDWNSAGRWSIEIFTKHRRFYLKPMEKLFEQKKGSITVSEVLIDDQLDMLYKPGLYKQIKSFLENDFSNLVSIHEQINAISFYDEIGGYKN